MFCVRHRVAVRGDTVELTATARDFGASPSRWLWTVDAAPETSRRLLSGESTATASLLIDEAGEYVLTATAEDDAGEVATDSVTVPLRLRVTSST